MFCNQQVNATLPEEVVHDVMQFALASALIHSTCLPYLQETARKSSAPLPTSQPTAPQATATQPMQHRSDTNRPEHATEARPSSTAAGPGAHHQAFHAPAGPGRGRDAPGRGRGSFDR